MEFTKIEATAIEAATIHAARNETQELSELQLALVGGGNAIVTLA
jgi:hypothetical protein